MADKDVVLSVAKVKEDERNTITDVYETIKERKDEAVDGLAELDVISEAAFMVELDGETYLLTYIESEDIQRTQEQYQESGRELDARHREALDQSLDETPMEITPLFHADMTDER